jgi:hypothetical protein
MFQTVGIYRHALAMLRKNREITPATDARARRLLLGGLVVDGDRERTLKGAFSMCWNRSKSFYSVMGTYNCIRFTLGEHLVHVHGALESINTTIMGFEVDPLRDLYSKLVLPCISLNDG